MPIFGIFIGAVKSCAMTKILKAASEEFLHKIFDEAAERLLPPLISWIRKKAEATPSKFDDAGVDMVESVLKSIIED